MKISRTKKTKAYIPKTEEEKEQVRIKEFLDMCAPSVLKFYPDYYICGSSFRSTWVVREYPTDTEEQALLRHLGDRSGVTLRVYTRHVTPAEERKIISNAASRNRMNRSSGNIQKEIIAESNLNDVMNLIAQMHRDREPLVHCAVFIEISTPTLEKLKEMQAEVEAELTRSKISVDKLYFCDRKKASRVHSPAETMLSMSSSSASYRQPVLPISIPSTTLGKPIRKAFISGMTNMEAIFLLTFREGPMTRPTLTCLDTWQQRTGQKLSHETAPLQHERKWYGYRLP